jgi:AraC-like DNA-binding protein
VRPDAVLMQSAVLDRLAALGFDVERVLRTAGMRRSTFSPEKAQLSTREFFAFWEAVEELAPSPAAGLRLGAEAGQLDIASHAALQCATLGEGLRTYARYKRITCAEIVEIESAADEARVAFRWLHLGGPLPAMLVDATFASTVALVERGTAGAVNPRRVELARRRSNEKLYSRYFRCDDVAFDAARDAVIFDRGALDRPFVTQNAGVLAVMVPGLESVLHERSSATRMTDDVRNAIARRFGGERPNVERIATDLHTSPRTLQRRLESEGTTYQDILDDVRRRSARRLLSDTDLTTGEIAFVLGFDELNSFSRAFQAWEGSTPLRWRGTRAMPERSAAMAAP